MNWKVCDFLKGGSQYLVPVDFGLWECDPNVFNPPQLSKDREIQIIVFKYWQHIFKILMMY